MARVYLGIGSNIDRHKHILAALTALRADFGELIISPVYESEAIGFEGDPFFNLVVGLDTQMSVGALQHSMKVIEDLNGRVRGGPKYSPRTLDIDILTYGTLVGEHEGVQLPRDEILKNAFVLWPLSDVAAQEQHPQLKLTYRDLWARYDKNKQVLWPVELKLA